MRQRKVDPFVFDRMADHGEITRKRAEHLKKEYGRRLSSDRGVVRAEENGEDPLKPAALRETGWIVDYPLSKHPGWMVRAHVRREDGTLVIVEIAVTRTRFREGLFGGLLRAPDAQPLPAIRGSVTTTMLRTVKTSDIEELMNTLLDDIGDPVRMPRPSQVRLGSGDLRLAVWAQRYVGALSEGNAHPIQAVARRYRRDAADIREYVKRARERKLLTQTKRGRAGGDLTDLARALLREHNS
jgi:hypothetical protein